MAAMSSVSDPLHVPVTTPKYRYLVCDLITDSMITSLPLTGVTFDRRVSRAGSFKAQWRISNRAQALSADALTKSCGRLALWVLRNNRLWWGGIIWNAIGGVSTRSYDTIDLQAATFDSYPERRYIISDWEQETGLSSPYKIMQYWDAMQSDAYGDIGMEVDSNRINNDYGNFIDQEFKYLDMITYAQMIKAHTDDVPGCDYTIDVYLDAAGNRIKSVRTASRFIDILDSQSLVVSGYKMPSWNFSRDSVGMGTVFRTQTDAQQGNVGTDQPPMTSTEYFAQELLDNGWPRLDMVQHVESPPLKNQAYLNFRNQHWGQRRTGIKDVSTYEVNLDTSEWHPNLIGQKITLKHSQKDLWRPGETAVFAPSVVEFTPPEKGQPERVRFSVDEG